MDFTLTNTVMFPVGTEVAAYPKSNWAVNADSASGEPQGDPADSQTMEVDGLTFTGLDADTSYWAVAEVNGGYPYVAFRTAPVVAGGGEPESLKTVGPDGDVPFHELTESEEENHDVGDEGEPAFENGWDGEFGFRGEADGTVDLGGSGVHAGGASDEVIFTLPVGYRPTARIEEGGLVIEVTGQVKPAESTEEFESELLESFDSEYEPAAFLAAELLDGITVTFYKDRDVVRLAGVAERLESGELAFVLPEGYRPPQDILLRAAGSPAKVSVNGEVYPFEGETFIADGEEFDTFYFDGISFRAA